MQLTFIAVSKLTNELRCALLRNNVVQITKLILHAESLKSGKQSSALQKQTVLCNWEKLKNKAATTLAELTIACAALVGRNGRCSQSTKNYLERLFNDDSL